MGSVGVSRAAQQPAVRCRPLALARGSEHGALQPGRRSCFRLGPEAAETWPGSWPPGATAGRHKAGVQAAKGHRLPGPPAPTGPTEKLRNATPRHPPREAASHCPATWTIGFVVTRAPLSPHESWRLARVSWGRRKPWSDRVSVRFESSAGLTLGTEDSQSEGLRDRPLSAHLQPGLASGRTSFLRHHADVPRASWVGTRSSSPTPPRRAPFQSPPFREAFWGISGPHSLPPSFIHSFVRSPFIRSEMCTGREVTRD